MLLHPNTLPSFLNRLGINLTLSLAHSLALALALALACVLPLVVTAQRNAEAAPDFSVLERADELRPFLNQDQRIAMVQAETLITEGTSDIRSGNSLINRRASALNPSEDLRPVHARGAEYVKRGEAKVLRGRLTLVSILEAAEQEQKSLQAEQVTKFDFEVPVASAEAALEKALTALLKACRDKNYQNVFYESVYLTHGETTSEAPPVIRNSAYDTVVRLDGTYFSVSLPIDLSFIPNPEATGGYAFSFQNEAVFAGEKKALLALEWLISPNSSEVLLNAQAFDMATHQVIGSEVFHVRDAAEFLKKSKIEITGNEEQWLPKSVTLRDHASVIEQLASLPEPYQFVLRSGKEGAHSLMAEALITGTITKNSDLILLASNFVERVYLDAKADTEDADDADGTSWSGLADARIQLVPSEEMRGTYRVLARGDGAARTIQLGTLALVFPETKETAELSGK